MFFKKNSIYLFFFYYKTGYTTGSKMYSTVIQVSTVSCRIFFMAEEQFKDLFIIYYFII